MIAKPSIAFNDFAGTAKDVTARNVGGRNVLSSRAQHSKKVTPAQAVSRNRLSKISRSYKKLSSVQMSGWATLAEHMKGISTFGSAAELTPHNAFIRINSNLQMVGEPMKEDAPIYTVDVPEVLYEDLWISPDMIVFTGLEQPSESYVLVFKMTPALSPGVSSGWGKTVIITPGMAPDWGDAAGDLADPHGTHRTCMEAILEALEVTHDDDWREECHLWLYRGAWMEWNLGLVDMAVPLSPDEMLKKRHAIYRHLSQKDIVPFPGSDTREFWQRAEARTQNTAQLYDKLGMAEYQAIEVFVKMF